MTAPHNRRVTATDGVELHVEERGAGRPVVLVQGLGYAAWAWAQQAAAVAAVGRAVVMDNRGAGRPVVLVQGLGYAAWAWAQQAAAVAAVGRAVVMDNRGAGRSDKPPAPYSIEQMADDVGSVIESCADGPAVVAGASMGGYIAMTLAVRRPELVDSLVLVSTLVGGESAVGVPDSTLQAWAENADLPAPEFARATMPISLAPGWAERNPERFERLLAARLEHPTPSEAWKAQWDACERFLRDGVPPGEITAPTWVVHGTDDRVVPYENAALVQARIPQAEVITMNSCGHLCWLERPHVVNRLLVGVAARQA